MMQRGPWLSLLAVSLLIGAMLWPMVAPAQTEDLQRAQAAFEAGDYAAALRLWQPLAEAGVAGAEVGLGILYLEGRGVTPDDAEAARWFRRAADRGHPDAQFRLGFLHFSGRGVAQDLEAAQRWYRLAADQGHAESSFYLGVMYAQGQGVGHDDVLAYALFERAVQNAAGSLRGLAERRRNAMGRRMSANQIAEATELAALPRQEPVAPPTYAAGLAAFAAGDYETAVANWQPLAESGDGPAQQGLGVLYHDGLGVAPSKADAALWFGRAAAQGLAESQYNFGLLLFAGDGVAADQRAAVEWFVRAGDQGHAEANYYLGTVFAGGAAGLERNDEEAYRRFLLAGEADPEPSLALLVEQARETVARRLSPAQLARVEGRPLAVEPVPAPEVEAPSPERTETQIAVAQELQEQTGQTAPRDAPSPDLVRAVQTSLGALGYGTGSADGVLGQDTVAAVRQFQATQGLPETGVVTQQLAFLLSLLVERETVPAAPDLVLVGSGTGFLVTGEGEILTNNHVVEACAEVRVQYDGQAHVADHVSSDVQADLALLDGDFRADDFAAFRGGRGIRPGEDVVALGYPLQGQLSDQVKVTKGTVSALSGPGNDRALIQMTVPVQAGSSGGPLFDMNGTIVGVVVGKITEVEVENVSFAINGTIARIFLDAEGVGYSTLEPGEALSAADVAEQGQHATVLVECWNPST